MADIPTTESSALDVLSVKEGTKAKPTIANESVLAQMKDLYAQKQAEKNYFLQDLADASAWWSGGASGPTEGLARRAAVRSAQDKQLQELQAGIAGQQNAIQNRDIFFGAPASSQNKTQAPMGGTQAPMGGTQINTPQAKAGAQDLNQRTNGLLGLVNNPSLQIALGAEYLRDPDKAMTALMTHVANEAKTPDDVKKVMYALQFLPEQYRNAAIVAGLIPKAIDIQDTLTGGFKTKSSGLDIAGQYAKPNAPAIAPTTPVGTSGAPMGTPSAPAMAPSAPMAAPSAPVARAPAQTTTPIAGRGNLNQQQADVLGGLIPPNTEQAGDVIKAAALAPIAARQKGLEKDYTAASDEGALVSQNYLDAGENKIDAMTLKELAGKASPTLGVFQKAGPGAAIMTTLDSGALKIGPLGSIQIPLEEAAARLVPGSDTESIRYRERIVGLLAKQELATARMNKGQGSWTELERNIIRGITGTVKNSSQFLIRRAELLEAKADFDEKMGQAAKDWLRANRGKTYYDFKQDSDDYERVVKEYRKTLRDKFANEFIAGQKMPTGVSKDTQTILNQYPSGKKEGTK
jgi:hypothetical protein